jgi:hypothetical protein
MVIIFLKVERAYAMLEKKRSDAHKVIQSATSATRQLRAYFVEKLIGYPSQSCFWFVGQFFAFLGSPSSMKSHPISISLASPWNAIVNSGQLLAQHQGPPNV